MSVTGKFVSAGHRTRDRQTAEIQRQIDGDREGETGLISCSCQLHKSKIRCACFSASKRSLAMRRLLYRHRYRIISSSSLDNHQWFYSLMSGKEMLLAEVNSNQPESTQSRLPQSNLRGRTDARDCNACL